ncbi:hypothetical protein PYK79_23890 [Streptomyces sp. ID05-04B]|uniref:hypothetical protein n=1 Tax=unclassified Streptomyces TaxID=2593676 RepID=UPI000D1B9648|nr:MULTISPECIES: hypothetical protein [unclassified Streptomyces]AVV44155.1 hypothetical protein C6376_24640 [Streptomyces sp. P3]MDX5565747.1 hypothetical protein [Streptomyces sp. ID05-04B]
MPPTDPTHSITERLSRSLSGPEGTLALARMQVLGRPVERSTELTAPTPSGTEVAVWRLTDGQLRRDTGRQNEWRYWADRPEIPLRLGHRRIAVLGESATRGYFFDPAYSLAGLVDTALDGTGVDILDLARTNCSLTELLRTAAEALALGADALVVHAGNNWNNVDPTPIERHELALLLEEGGFPVAAASFRDLVTEVAASALDLLRELAGDVLVVLVVPEFNLGDWTDEPILDCPALPAGRMRRWLRARDEAERALRDGDLAGARTLIAEMTGLDGGSSPVSHRLAAHCAASPDEALTALRAAKDAVVSPFAIHSPRTLASVQEVMRRKAVEAGFRLVDQAALFREGDAGAPGRRYFLDYCHLTYDGLRVTALAVAETLGAALELPERPGADGVPVRAAADRLALAHFLAAVHNAHYGQSEDVLRHHLNRALDADASVADRFEDYLDYQTRIAPNWMCSSYERSTQDPAFRRYMVVGDGRLNGKLADHGLREVMLDALESRGVPARRRYEDLLVAEHCGGTDLLADANLATTFNERRDAGVGPRTAYLRASSPRTRSTLVVDEPAPVLLEVTWRLPGEVPAESVSVAVNGHEVGTAEVGTAWATCEFTVSPDVLRRGRNTVEIRWPEGGDGTDTLVAGAPARLECGEHVTSHPVHGHVHGWSATRVVPAAV